MRILVTVPVRNERQRIESCVQRLLEVARDPRILQLHELHLVVAEDGSTDGTRELLQLFESRYPGITVSSTPGRKGRGRALRELWLSSNFDVVAYIDADLAMGTDALVRCIEAVANGADVAVGCRYAKESYVRRPPLVWFVSLCYNRLIRTLFRDGILDHQCGLKVLGPRALSEVLPATRDNAWFWDTELLILTVRAGLSVREIPVRWIETKNRRTSLLRLGSEILTFGAAIVELEGRVIPPNDVRPSAVSSTGSLGSTEALTLDR